MVNILATTSHESNITRVTSAILTTFLCPIISSTHFSPTSGKIGTNKGYEIAELTLAILDS